jgi:hypothetical protein
MRKHGIHTRLGEITPWDRWLLQQVQIKSQASIGAGGDAAVGLSGIEGYRVKGDWDRLQRLVRLGLIERRKPSRRWRLTPLVIAVLESDAEIVLPVVRGRFDARGRWYRKMAGVVGIKPTRAELEAAMLSLHHTPKKLELAGRFELRSSGFTVRPLFAIEHR